MFDGMHFVNHCVDLFGTFCNVSSFFIVISFLLSFAIVLYIDIACPTKDETSPTLDGNMRVLFVRANWLNAFIYCSAIVREAALFPSCCDNLEHWYQN